MARISVRMTKRTGTSRPGTRARAAGRHIPEIVVALAIVIAGSTHSARAFPDEPTPPAPARPKADPAHDETLSNPAIEDAINEQRRARGDRAPLKPTTKAPDAPRVAEIGAPSLAPADGARVLWNNPSQWKGRAVPEGAFFAAREGVVVRTKSGDSAFVAAPAPGPDARADEREAPMVILPNQRLAQLDAAIGQGGEARRVNASGQVFSYHGRTYLALTAFSLVSTSPSATPAAATKPAGEASPQPPGGSTASEEQRVREMLAELEERRGMPRALDASNLALPSDAVKALKAPEHVLAEGTVLTRRRARLVRGAVGAVLAFDNDPNSPGLGAMPILPCRTLEHMESVASQHGEDLVFVVSARVTTYQSRNFVLPTMYQVVRPSDLSSAQ